MTEVGKLFQSLARPHDACRIMWVGENEHTASVIADSSQVLEIHLIGTVRQLFQRIEHDFNPVLLRNKTERMIDRGLDYDLVSLFKEGIDSHSYAFDYSRDEGHPRAFGLPAVVFEDPFLHCSPIILRQHSVAEDRMLQPLAEGIHYEFRSLEVHIGHPKGDEIFFSIYILKRVGLDRTASPAVDHLVEVIYFHLWHILYPPQI